MHGHGAAHSISVAHLIYFIVLLSPQFLPPPALVSILQLLPSVHAPLTTEALSRGIADASACFSPSISNPLRQHVQISPADRNSPFFAPAITLHWALGRGRKPQSGLLCVARSSHMPQILFYHHAVPERRLTQRFRLLIKAGPPPPQLWFLPSFPPFLILLPILLFHSSLRIIRN